MESTPEQIAEGQSIVRVLAAVLERLVMSNAALARHDPGQVTKFHALKAPGIGILPYLERIHKYASCSNECFILALIYVDRLIQRNNFLLTELNVHRVIITAILLAAKFFDDAYYNNAYYSKVGGVLVAEMNGLEVDFLFRINFSLHVTPELFEKYRVELIAHSVNAGVAIQEVSLQMSMMEGTVQVSTMEQSTPNPQSMVPAPAPATIQGHPCHHGLPQVTPSPASHNPSVPLSGPTIDNRIIEAAYNGQQALYVADKNAFAEGLVQRMGQRSNSLPSNSSYSGRCAHYNPPYSAPMVSMIPVGLEDQYLLVTNQLFPIQTTLVHHHHGIENYHEQALYLAQHGGNGYPLARDRLGSLVAGHY